MTPFHRIVRSLWGDKWRAELPKLLKKHGHQYSRQTLWNWDTGQTKAPESVIVILESTRKRGRKS
jgi:hypothetical protein